MVTKKVNEWAVYYLQKKKLWILWSECNPFSVHDNILDERNWSRLEANTSDK